MTSKKECLTEEQLEDVAGGKPTFSSKKESLSERELKEVSGGAGKLQLSAQQASNMGSLNEAEVGEQPTSPNVGNTDPRIEPVHKPKG